MKKFFIPLIVFLVMILSFCRCKQNYEPNIGSTKTGILIVEGFINSGQGATIIRLSRSTDLQNLTFNPEPNAQVSVEGDNGGVFALLNNSNGEYRIDQLVLDNSAKYRLHITTPDGKEYASDFAAVKYTPAIDSITWQMENNGVRIYTNSRDPQNAAKYYQWKFEEMWEIHSAFQTSLDYVRNPTTNAVTALVSRNPDGSPDTTLFRCWRNANSTSIILGSTEKLTSDVVYLPVQYIEPGSEKLSVLYSINLKQYAISQDNYLFLQKMKKNTEQLGTIFDPQPSEISGNIHCLTDPSELVVGFVEATQEQTKRIFISNNQVPGWGYSDNCLQLTIDNNLDSIEKYGRNLYPTTIAVLGDFGLIKQFFATENRSCMDCTVRGFNQKPDFWPY